jgi:hypothetical protein
MLFKVKIIRNFTRIVYGTLNEYGRANLLIKRVDPKREEHFKKPDYPFRHFF